MDPALAAARASKRGFMRMGQHFWPKEWIRCLDGVCAQWQGALRVQWQGLASLSAPVRGWRHGRGRRLSLAGGPGHTPRPATACPGGSAGALPSPAAPRACPASSAGAPTPPGAAAPCVDHVAGPAARPATLSKIPPDGSQLGWWSNTPNQEPKTSNCKTYSISSSNFPSLIC